ncbi:MAG: NUDIX domain-containing protein [Beijerinckiaceae bacterium]|nr:NUDIX domain-containing protein [Beijerinckiaceae bacterium]
MKSWLTHRAFALVQSAQPLAARLTRPLTMGVRAMVLDAEGRVCLIRHSYVAGWHLPGGGVEPGETLHQSLARELREETGLGLVGAPPVFAVYLNQRMARRDHVALYVVRQVELTDHRPSPLEILEQGFFPVDALPELTTAPTRRRIAEVTQGLEPDAYW